MHFIITTTKEVASQIERQCVYDEKINDRSYKLGDIHHSENYSDVKIISRLDEFVLSDLFWLGHHSLSAAQQWTHVTPPFPVMSKHFFDKKLSEMSASINKINDSLNRISDKGKFQTP